MIVKLTFQNSLSIPVTVRSNQATGQPLVAGQSLEMTFVMDPDPADGVSDLILIVEPG